MFYAVTNKIKGKVYINLINYLMSRCDVLVYRLPNFNQFSVTPEAQEIYPEQKLGIHINNENDNDFSKYKKRVNSKFSHLEKYCIGMSVSWKYFSSIYGHDSEIKIYKLDEEFRGSLLAHADSLYDWRHPKLPEDLHFFSKGECFLSSIAHENMCHITTETPQDAKILEKIIGLNLLELPEEIYKPNDIKHTLKYTLKY